MFDTVERVVMGIVMFGMIAIIGIALYFSLTQTEKVSDWQSQCESHGGILLERTYQSGKYTNSLYTCIKKEVVIDYGTIH